MKDTVTTKYSSKNFQTNINFGVLMQEKIEKLEKYIREEFKDEKWVCIFSVKTGEDEKKGVQVGSRTMINLNLNTDPFKTVHTLIQGMIASVQALQQNLYGDISSFTQGKPEQKKLKSSDYG